MGLVKSESIVSAEPTNLEASTGSATATVAIIVVNLVMFVLMSIMGVSFFEPSAESLIKWGASYGPSTLSGQWWRLFTSLFLHFGLIHVLCNMVVLASIGPFMETLAGGTAYLILYVVAGLGGGAASLALHPWTVSAGASGAIFGLYGALLAFLLLHKNSIAPEVLAPLRKGALIFVGYNVLYGLFRPDVDLAAHFGGLITGFLLGLFLVQPSSQQVPVSGAGRQAFAVFLGLALLSATIIGLTKPDDLLGEINRMAPIEEKALALFNSSLQNWQAGKITDPQFLNIVENQVVPGWKAEREAIEKLHRFSSTQKEVATSLVQYMRVRESAWNLLADGVRLGDVDKIRSAGEKGREADKLAENIGSNEKK